MNYYFPECCLRPLCLSKIWVNQQFTSWQQVKHRVWVFEESFALRLLNTKESSWEQTILIHSELLPLKYIILITWSYTERYLELGETTFRLREYKLWSGYQTNQQHSQNLENIKLNEWENTLRPSDFINVSFSPGPGDTLPCMFLCSDRPHSYKWLFIRFDYELIIWTKSIEKKSKTCRAVAPHYNPWQVYNSYIADIKHVVDGRS